MKEDKLLQNRIEEATSRIEDRISTLSGLNDLLGLIYDAVYYSEEVKENSRLLGALSHLTAAYQHLNELIGHHEGKHQPGNRQDDRFRELPYHGKDPGVPCRRGHSYLCRNLSDLLIHTCKEPAEVSHDKGNMEVHIS